MRRCSKENEGDDHAPDITLSGRYRPCRTAAGTAPAARAAAVPTATTLT